MPARPYPPTELRTADERAILVGMHDWYREGIVAKVAGLTDDDARRRLVSSSTTVTGLVKHLALVEDWWFSHLFAGEPEREPWAGVDWDADPDWEFTTALDDALADSVAMYEAACARSRAVVDAATLDDLNRGPTKDPFTLRWLLVHMIEETARHLGHLDILRELTDGATGD